MILNARRSVVGGGSGNSGDCRDAADRYYGIRLVQDEDYSVERGVA